MSEPSHVLKFKMVLIWVWSARQFKENGPFILEKKKTLWGFKNHIERRAYKNEELKYK